MAFAVDGGHCKNKSEEKVGCSHLGVCRVVAEALGAVAEIVGVVVVAPAGRVRVEVGRFAAAAPVGKRTCAQN